MSCEIHAPTAGDQIRQRIKRYRDTFTDTFGFPPSTRDIESYLLAPRGSLRYHIKVVHDIDTKSR